MDNSGGKMYFPQYYMCSNGICKAMLKEARGILAAHYVGRPLMLCSAKRKNEKNNNKPGPYIK
jgi:hypothetical protein